MGLWSTKKNVNVKCTTYPLFQYFGIRELKNDIILVNPISINDTIFSVNSGHGFQIGEYVAIWENSRFEQAEVINIANNNITIEIPFATNFTTNAKIIRGDVNLNVDGSVTPIDFWFKTYDSIIPIDIQYAIFQFHHGTNVPDDGKFAGITALTNGLYIRHKNGKQVNFGNYKKNIDFKIRGATVNYTQKAPAGSYATEIIIDITKAFGQVVRVNPRTNDFIQLRIRDKIDSVAGISFARVSLLGSFTEGE